MRLLLHGSPSESSCWRIPQVGEAAAAQPLLEEPADGGRCSGPRTVFLSGYKTASAPSHQRPSAGPTAPSVIPR